MLQSFKWFDAAKIRIIFLPTKIFATSLLFTVFYLPLQVIKNT